MNDCGSCYPAWRVVEKGQKKEIMESGTKAVRIKRDLWKCLMFGGGNHACLRSNRPERPSFNIREIYR